MANTIQWQNDLTAACEKARAEDKHVFLDFFSPL